MRIGIITGEYYPQEGGVGDFTRELSRAFHRAGHEIHILTTGNETGKPMREEGLYIYRRIPQWDWRVYKAITGWSREIEADALNIQYQSTAFQMRGAINFYPRQQRQPRLAPIVVTYHDLMPPYLFPKAGPLRQWAVWQLARYADGVIVTNEADYTQLTTALEGKTLPAVRMIPIGSNITPQLPKAFDRAGWRASRDIREDELLIGFFGFQNRNKGIEALLEAVAQLRRRDVPAKLLFIGGRTGSSDATNAAYAAEIDALIQRLGLTPYVQQTGFVTPAEVSAALSASDICALPYRKGVNLRHGTLHACLAHSKAIVTTLPAMPTPELRDRDNLLLVPAEAPAALAEALRALWEDPALRKQLEQRAAALAQEFSWEGIAGRTAEFFRFLNKPNP